MSTFFTDTLECAGECGEEIEVTSHNKADNATAAAEALGWACVDKKKAGDKMDVFCPFCQAQARRIVKTIGVK